jgi:hypothetical protein
MVNKLSMLDDADVMIHLPTMKAQLFPATLRVLDGWELEGDELSEGIKD